MIKVCGINDTFQLGEKSNNVDHEKTPYICPPVESGLVKISSKISSYSVYANHAVAITNEGEIYATGSNKAGRIIGSLPKTNLTKFTKYEIKDDAGRLYYPISAVCGCYFTLYLISDTKPSSAATQFRLAYSYIGISTATPLFLSIGSSNPVSLFGGSYTAAAIDSEGSVIFIPKSSQASSLETSRLPDGEEACCVACLEFSVLVLSFSGKVYESKNPSNGNRLNFTIVDSLKNKKIVEISGSTNFCFALTDDGRVFGRGSNGFGQLGFIMDDIQIVKEFSEVVKLNDYKISHVYAGWSHSIFQTENGKIFVCGTDNYGQLFDIESTWLYDYGPKEPKVEIKDVTFCVAGSSLSAVFIGIDPLQSPNRTITKEKLTHKKNQVNLLNSVKKKVPKIVHPSVRPISPQKQDKIVKTDESSSLKRKISQLETKLADIEKAFSLQPNEQSKSEEFTIIDNDEEKEFHSKPVQIGEGATSITYKVVDNRTKTPMCKKVFKYKSGQTKIKDAQNALKEFQVMNSINHPCICKAIGINTDEELIIADTSGKQVKVSTIAIFLEFLEIGLDEFLKMKISNTIKVRVALDIAHAMNFLHKRGMMHRDLKIENIMLNAFFETKLVDFGLVKISESVIDEFSYVEDSLTRGVGTFAYMSPEMANEDDYDNKTDVYSFGIVLHVMFVGCLPKQKMKDKLNGSKIKLPNPSDSISAFCIKLIEKCISHEPSNRPSFEQILNEMRKNSFELASDVDSSILMKRDKELDFIENYK